MNSTVVYLQVLFLENTTLHQQKNISSRDDVPRGSWGFTPSFTLFTIIAGILANLTVLRLFYKRRTLRTPFGVYLINLTIANFILSCALEPLNFVVHYYSSWTLGYGACVFRQYLGWTILDAIIFSHLLIAVNRLWAVVFPLSYRIRHTVKVAVTICVTAWIVIHAFFIPTVIIVTFVSEPDQDGKQQCSVKTGPIGAWGPILQILFYDLPIALVFFLYPVIFYKSFVGNRNQPRVRGGNENSHAKSRLETSRATKTEGSHAVQPEEGKVTSRVTCMKPRYGSVTGFLTLTLMTLSVLVCLAPNEAYFTFLLVADTDPPGLFEIVKVLQALTIIFDPLLIVLANPELRQLVKQRVCCL